MFDKYGQIMPMTTFDDTRIQLFWKLCPVTTLCGTIVEREDNTIRDIILVQGCTEFHLPLEKEISFLYSE